MPGAYSTDLRKRVLAAVEAGESPDAVAARFMVARATVYRWIMAARDEGRRMPRPASGGPEPVIQGSVKAALVHMVTASNHLTLTECRDRLAEETGVRVHPCTVSRALRRLPWT